MALAQRRRSTTQGTAQGELTPADAWPWKHAVTCRPCTARPCGLSRITLEITGVRVERLQGHQRRRRRRGMLQR